MHPAGMGLSCSTSQPILELFPTLGCKGEAPDPTSMVGTGWGEQGAASRAGMAPGSPSPSCQAAAKLVFVIPLFPPATLPLQARLQAVPGCRDPNIPRG